MRKRGAIVAIIGLGMLVTSFAIAQSIFQNADHTIRDTLFLPNLLEDMFDYISDETQILPRESVSFSYSSTISEVPLLWGLQILNYQDGDKISVTISNIFGDDFGTFEQKGPIIFEMFVIPKNDIYNFDVANKGNRPISVVMMFTEDPDSTPAMTDPNSSLMTTVIPLAISGIILIIGIIVLIIGIIVGILDWKKGSNQSRYV